MRAEVLAVALGGLAAKGVEVEARAVRVAQVVQSEVAGGKAVAAGWAVAMETARRQQRAADGHHPRPASEGPAVLVASAACLQRIRCYRLCCHHRRRRCRRVGRGPCKCHPVPPSRR